MKLMRTSDVALTHIRAIVYGDSGVGKTTSLRTLPPDRTLLAVTERGTIPLRQHKFQALPITSWQDVRELVGYFMSPDEIEDKEIQEAVQSTTVLGVDSLSDLEELCMREILDVDRPGLIKDRTGGKKTAPDRVYGDLMQMEDWGLLRKRMKNLLSTFCHLPVHVIFTALATWSKDSQERTTFRTPGLSGKLGTECPAYFDLVLHMEARPGSDGASTRVWRTGTDGQIIAKDASGVLEPFETPDWTAVFKKILGNGKDSGK